MRTGSGLPRCFWVGESQPGQEHVGGGGQGGVVVPAGPAAAFEMVEPDTGFQFPVVVFDAPADGGFACVVQGSSAW